MQYLKFCNSQKPVLVLNKLYYYHIFTHLLSVITGRQWLKSTPKADLIDSQYVQTKLGFFPTNVGCQNSLYQWHLGFLQY